MARESRQVFGVGVESSRDRVAGRVCLVAWGGLHARLLDALAARCTSVGIRLWHEMIWTDRCWVELELSVGGVDGRRERESLGKVRGGTGRDEKFTPGGHGREVLRADPLR